MEWDAPASRLVPTIGIGDVLRCLDWDAGMLAGRSIPIYRMVTHLGVPWGIPPGSKSLASTLKSQTLSMLTI